MLETPAVVKIRPMSILMMNLRSWVLLMSKVLIQRTMGKNKEIDKMLILIKDLDI